jgi:hypothetical protein
MMNYKDILKRASGRGFINTLKLVSCNLIFPFKEKYFDNKYGLDTQRSVEINELGIDIEKQERAERYQITYTYGLKKLFGKLNLADKKVFVDLGCGKGKVLMMASEFGFKEARGVEISSNLCEIAIKNCSIYKEKSGTVTVFKIINVDALEYKPMDDEDVFYMFNPFDSLVMGKVLNSITESLKRKPRQIVIIYRHPLHENILALDNNYKKIAEYKLLEIIYVVYTNIIN